MSNKNQDNSKLFTSWDYNRKNYLFFAIGIAVVVIGYLLMAYGETTSFQSVRLAPILLIIGYCIIIPISIIYKFLFLVK